MKKKILSILVVFVLLCGIPFSSVIASAWIQYITPNATSGSDYTDYPAFAEALDQVFKGDIDLFTSKSLSTEVFLPLGDRISMSKSYYIHSETRNTTTYGWTCYIYSNAAFNKLFGEYVWNGKSLKNCYIALSGAQSTLNYNTLKNANIRPGAYIRTTPKSDGSYYGNDGHSMIILGYNSTHITYLEGNGDGKGLVRVTKRTWSEFNSAQLSGKSRRVCHIVQPTLEYFNSVYGYSPEDYNYKVSYSYGGGNGYQESLTIAYNSEFTLNASTFDKDGRIFEGFNLKREYDNTYYTEENGWCSAEAIEQNGYVKKLYKNGDVLKLDSALTSEICDNISFVAEAVWKETVYENCSSVRLIEACDLRNSYPLNSTVSLKGSIVEFTFESGITARVEINENCSSTVAQTFRLNGYNYNFYIDSFIEKQGSNPCYIRIDSFKEQITLLTGDKVIEKTEIISKPYTVSGENAQIKITYTDGTNETVVLTKYVSETSSKDFDSGIIFTDAGFTLNWSFNIEYNQNTPILVTYNNSYSLNLVSGDINLNGSIDTVDLASIKIVLMNIDQEYLGMHCLADFNCDGKIDTTDLANLKNFLCAG